MPNTCRRCDAEVSDLDPALGVDETVRRLDVAMQHARGRSGLQPGGHLEHSVDGFSGPHRSAGFDQAPERAAAGQLHGNDWNALDLPPVPEHIDDVGVIDGGGEPALSKKPRAVGATPQRLRDGLQRDMASSCQVRGLPDMAHPSLTEEASDLVVPESLADTKIPSSLDPHSVGRDDSNECVGASAAGCTWCARRSR